MDEQWRPIDGYDGVYEVSSLGNVRSWTTKSDGRLLRQRPHVRDGHMLVNLSNDGKIRTRPVHRLVGEAFLGPKPDGLETRHLNGDPSDNRVENLAYGTKTQNRQDSITHGTAAGPPMRNRDKTHCDHGHEFTPANTRVRKEGWRVCRVCETS